ncbi:intradiol ring-cleavage dioxygenase [Streptomyces sp. GESEQ-35]|uniref:intradiol ring-cleavage dioxygenase n=1 Tax=Streptomyces sp. GESEQ-35 TaxID=2812657 RepID=UPI001B3299FF|nr:intradiol ring-cleavage dioxygenase [Streptomyces sp. GESEQ-35]
MGSDFTEETATQAVVDSFAQTQDPRLREILESFTRHLHSFVREVEPNQGEWEGAIDFLTAIGRMCDDKRQEFILFSDVMGVSMLVDAINNRKPQGATESTVLGPFHVIESPVRKLGEDIAVDHTSPRCLVRGRVLTLAGVPVPGAQVDVWQADDEGFYDIQKPDAPDQDLRGLFTADEEGRFWFTTILPLHYPIPADGPVGDLLRRTGRHPYRPAHIHFIAGAAGFSPVTTHLFLEGSPYLDDDTVFGVKQSLIRPVTPVDDSEQARHYGLDNPFQVIDFDITLAQPPSAEETQ